MDTERITEFIHKDISEKIDILIRKENMLGVYSQWHFFFKSNKAQRNKEQWPPIVHFVKKCQNRSSGVLSSKWGIYITPAYSGVITKEGTEWLVFVFLCLFTYTHL